MLNSITSGVLASVLGMALASSTACRKLPSPLSAVVVTVKTAKSLRSSNCSMMARRRPGQFVRRIVLRFNLFRLFNISAPKTKK